MKAGVLSVVCLSLALGFASAQDAPNPPAGSGQGQQQGSGPGGGRGQRGGGWGGGMGMGGGRGIGGTVTAVAADRYTIKTETGEIYTVHIGANTRILKQAAQPAERRGRQGGEGMGRGEGGNPPQPIKATDIKVGDAVAAMGETDEASKSIGAVAVVLIDPERARQLREMEANYGKTWLMGKVTAVNEVKISILGSVDHAAHSFVADENTAFRKRREPIALADLQVGDVVRVEGAVKGGVFVATGVNVMVMPPGGAPAVPRENQVPPQGK
jgi:hypothetical protein